MKPVAGWLLLLLVAACAAGLDDANRESDMREAWSGAHCPSDGPEQERLAPVEWRQSVWSERLSSDRTEDLLILRAGTKPSAGYRLTIEEQAVVDGVLQLHVRLRGPAPDAMVAQVLTSPCLALWVPSGVVDIDVRWINADGQSAPATQKHLY